MKKSGKGSQEGEDFNVRERHGQIAREFSEPSEVYRTIPWWLKYLFFAPMTLWFFWYIFTYFGRFDPNEYYEGSEEVPYDQILADQKASAEKNLAAAFDGAKVYTKSCVPCHQPNGAGLPGAFPPLAGSDWVAGDDRVLAAIVLHGLGGPITVNGAPYNSVMPPWGPMLKDGEIAAVLSFVRSSWGNNAPAVEVATVSKIREEHAARAMWNQADLDAAFGGAPPSAEPAPADEPVAVDAPPSDSASAEEAAPAPPGEAKTLEASIADGETVYLRNCVACHQPNGQGLPGAFPPLAGSDWISRDAEVLAGIVLHGLSGLVTVKGVDYNSVMPPLGAVLKDEEIADALTYVRSAWGNSADQVDTATVAKVRKAYPAQPMWTKEGLDSAFAE